MRAEFHTAWLTQLRAAWHLINDIRLGGALRPPAFVIDVQGSRRLGRWERTGRLIGIAEAHIWNAPWSDVLETLRHEIAHQYAHEVLGARDETPHGPTFAEACRKVGVVATATGSLGGEPNGEADRILQRVRKLMALAESPNVHEAQQAMAAANRLLLEYNLELTGHVDGRGYGWKRVGATAASLPLDWKLVAAIVGEYFFVETVWALAYNARRDRNERQLELIGSATNLELAHYVHDWLHASVATLFRGAVRTLPRLLGQDRRSLRREYVAGVLSGFRERLAEERRSHAGQGLVWVGDPALDSFLRARYPQLKQIGGGGVRHGEVHAAGQQAGRALNLHRGVHASSSSGLLLGH